MIVFGNPSAGYLAQYNGFLDSATSRFFIEENRRIGALYRAQPRRRCCKICETALAGRQFVKTGIAYVVCETCGHFNGAHEETEEFCRTIYADDGGRHFAATYGDAQAAEFQARVQRVYAPKADFLAKALVNLGEEPSGLRLVDIGAGAGHFVTAARQAGLYAWGLEGAPSLVAAADAMLGNGAVRHTDINGIAEVASGIDADVVSLLFVLEHVRDPHALLRSLCRRNGPRYLFVAVPLVGLTAALEAAFPDVMERQLAGTHTHLFTPSSVEQLYRRHGLEVVAEWWFGADMVDLYRVVATRLAAKEETASLAVLWAEMMPPLIDAMQLAADQRKACSEVHLLLKVP